MIEKNTFITNISMLLLRFLPSCQTPLPEVVEYQRLVLRNKFKTTSSILRWLKQLRAVAAANFLASMNSRSGSFSVFNTKENIAVRYFTSSSKEILSSKSSSKYSNMTFNLSPSVPLQRNEQARAISSISMIPLQRESKRLKNRLNESSIC